MAFRRRGRIGRTAAALFAAAAALVAPAPAAATTNWDIAPSPTYDALCLVSIVGGDPYTSQFYAAQQADVRQWLSPEARAAAQRVSGVFRDAGTPLIGWLGLVYSAADAKDLDGLIEATANPDALRKRLQPTQYWYSERWAMYEKVRPELMIYLQGLKDANYEAWWSRGARQEVEAELERLRPSLETLDVVPLLRKILRRPVDTTIVVHATRFCRPFGIRVLGSRFIMDVVGKKDALRSVGAGALHEMTHPPFDRSDRRARLLIRQLRRDRTIQSYWRRRPRESGYNTFDGYIDEDTTRALDQIIGERVGVTFVDDADERWRTQEGGFHVVAGVLYHLMKREKFLDGSESAIEFLDRMRRNGRIVMGIEDRR